MLLFPERDKGGEKDKFGEAIQIPFCTWEVRDAHRSFKQQGPSAGRQMRPEAVRVVRATVTGVVMVIL